MLRPGLGSRCASWARVQVVVPSAPRCHCWTVGGAWWYRARGDRVRSERGSQEHVHAGPGRHGSRENGMLEAMGGAYRSFLPASQGARSLRRAGCEVNARGSKGLALSVRGFRSEGLGSCVRPRRRAARMQRSGAVFPD